MKHLKRIAAAALAAAAVAATLGAGSASATTLEVGGVAKSESVKITMTLKPGTSYITRDTFGFVNNTCTQAHGGASTTSPYSGTTVTAPVSEIMFSNCNSSIIYHKPGTLHFSHVAGTTNGTVVSSGAEWTSSSPFGTLACKTGEGTHIGTLTGVKEGHATLQAKTPLTCSGISVTGEYTVIVTTPTGLGFTA